jgi:nucleoid-associated protein YgaU
MTAAAPDAAAAAPDTAAAAPEAAAAAPEAAAAAPEAAAAAPDAAAAAPESGKSSTEVGTESISSPEKIDQKLSALYLAEDVALYIEHSHTKLYKKLVKRGAAPGIIDETKGKGLKRLRVAQVCHDSKDKVLERFLENCKRGKLRCGGGGGGEKRWHERKHFLATEGLSVSLIQVN